MIVKLSSGSAVQ